jgi:hypothetical protein
MLSRQHTYFAQLEHHGAELRPAFSLKLSASLNSFRGNSAFNLVQHIELLRLQLRITGGFLILGAFQMKLVRRGIPVAVCVVMFILCGESARAADSGVVIRTQPEQVYVERSGSSQYFVFAFELSNNSDQAVKITEIRMMAYDAAGALLNSSKVDGNGGRPSMEVLGPRQLDAHKALTVFNPFDQLTTAQPVATLRYEFALAGEKDRKIIPIEIKPVQYLQKTSLTCPVPGKRVWAYEAPGFYSHHSRIDLNDEFTRDVMKMRHNNQRYALDLVAVDEKGAFAHGDDNVRENWVGYGSDIVAPDGGIVVSTENGQPNEMDFDESKLSNVKVMVGNYVVIDHGNGEFSAMAHFKQGSILVKPGDHVKKGQVIAQMGRSGMGSGLIHVHYQLQDAPDLFNSEALPFRFDAVRAIGDSAFRSQRISPGMIFDTPSAAKAKK